MEIWDIYDADRNLTGRTVERGKPMRRNEYHLVVFAWIRNRDGKFLITKRAPNKTYPGMWETPGGAAVKGEDSIQAVLREAREEIGICLDKTRGRLILSEKNQVFHPYHADIWLFEHDVEIDELVLQEEEVSDARWAELDEIKSMISEKRFVSHDFVKKIWPLL